VSTEELQRRMIGETEIALEKAGDKPLTEDAIRTLALALIAVHLSVIARVLDHCRDGDCFSVASWDMGKP
jgi:hypothetical protein